MNGITFFKRIPVGALGTNCYIISGDNKTAAVIDPGADFNRLDRTLKENNLQAVSVMLTHGHFDHTRAAKAFQETGVKIYMHKLDLPVLKFTMRTLTPILFTPDIFISDGETVETAGLSLKIIHTPGHTPGGVSFYAEGSPAVLFSGDTLFHGDVGRTDLGHGDHQAIICSVKKLYTLPDDTIVYPGHEEETTIGEEKLYNSCVRA